MASLPQRIKAWYNGTPQRKTPGANWFLNFLNLANQEDMADGIETLESAYSSVAWLNIAVSCRARSIAG